MQPTQDPSPDPTPVPATAAEYLADGEARQVRLWTILAQDAPDSDDPAAWMQWCDAKRLAGYLLYMDNIGTEIGDQAAEMSALYGKQLDRLREAM